YFAFALTPQGPARREVLIGATNDTSVEIVDGLLEGERVILNPRSHFSDQIEELESRFDASRDESAGAADEAPAGPRSEDRRSDASRPTAKTGGERSQSPRNPAVTFQRLDQNGDGKLTGDE